MSTTPVEIRLRKASSLLTLQYQDGRSVDLPFEYLRVHSPSAEVRGHGEGQGVLQIGKENVQITSVEPVGHYAIRLVFDDGHDTGIFTWDYLFELGAERDEKWQAYLNELENAGIARGNPTLN